MKRGIFAILFTAVSIAHADMVIHQKVESSTHNGDLVINIKGNKIRIDISNGPRGDVSKIVDLDSGMTTILLHQKKKVERISEVEMNQLAQEIKSHNNMPSTESAPIFSDSGKSEVVGDWNAEIYTWTNSDIGSGGTVWVAKDFPNFAAIKPYIEMLDNSPVFRLTKGMRPDATTLPGMVVKSKALIRGQQIKTVLISVQEVTVDPSIFETPKDYTE